MSVSKKMSGKIIKLYVFLVFLGFEPFLLSNSEAEWRLVVSTPQVLVYLAGTVNLVVELEFTES